MILNTTKCLSISFGMSLPLLNTLITLMALLKLICGCGNIPYQSSTCQFSRKRKQFNGKSNRCIFLFEWQPSSAKFCLILTNTVRRIPASQNTQSHLWRQKKLSSSRPFQLAVYFSKILPIVTI